MYPKQTMKGHPVFLCHPFKKNISLVNLKQSQAWGFTMHFQWIIFHLNIIIKSIFYYKNSYPKHTINPTNNFIWGEKVKSFRLVNSAGLVVSILWIWMFCRNCMFCWCSKLQHYGFVIILFLFNRFFTYGDMPLEQHLKQIQGEALCKFRRTETNSAVPAQSRWDKPVSHTQTHSPTEILNCERKLYRIDTLST